MRTAEEVARVEKIIRATFEHPMAHLVPGGQDLRHFMLKVLDVLAWFQGRSNNFNRTIDGLERMQINDHRHTHN